MTKKSAIARLGGQIYAAGHALSQIPTKIYVLGFYVGIVAMPQLGHAAGPLFSGWRATINSIISLLVLAALLAGIGAVLYGMTMLVKKGMGRGDDVEWRQIYWPLGGGAMLTVLMYVVDGLVEEGGGTVTEMGTARTFGTNTP